MGCNFMRDNLGNVTGIACTRGNRQVCHICGKPMTSLCDATREDGNPCDIPMCDEHRNQINIEYDMDVCKYHNSEKYIKEAISNRIERNEARIYFNKVYKEQDFRIVPGHHPDFATKKEVDRWIDMNNKILENSRELFEEE